MRVAEKRVLAKKKRVKQKSVSSVTITKPLHAVDRSHNFRLNSSFSLGGQLHPIATTVTKPVSPSLQQTLQTAMQLLNYWDKIGVNKTVWEVISEVQEISRENINWKFRSYLNCIGLLFQVVCTALGYRLCFLFVSRLVRAVSIVQSRCSFLSHFARTLFQILLV